MSVKIEAQAQERQKLVDENDMLRGKLGDVLKQFETFNQLLTSKDLELQLANAKLEKQVIELGRGEQVVSSGEGSCGAREGEGSR